MLEDWLIYLLDGHSFIHPLTADCICDRPAECFASFFYRAHLSMRDYYIERRFEPER